MKVSECDSIRLSAAFLLPCVNFTYQLDQRSEGESRVLEADNPLMTGPAEKPSGKTCLLVRVNMKSTS